MRLISFSLFSTQRGADGPLRLSSAVGWNEQNRHPGDERFANVSRAPSAVHGRKVCEAKELIRKVAAPGPAGRSLVKPFEPRRPGRAGRAGTANRRRLTSAASAGDG